MIKYSIDEDIWYNDSDYPVKDGDHTSDYGEQDG